MKQDNDPNTLHAVRVYYEDMTEFSAVIRGLHKDELNVSSVAEILHFNFDRLEGERQECIRQRGFLYYEPLDPNDEDNVFGYEDPNEGDEDDDGDEGDDEDE